MTGLLAAFMAGMAANVSSFNTVMTYDLIQPYWLKDRDDQYYLRMGRIVTVVGIVVAVGTAGIASQYTNIMNYIQLLFGFFNAPLFATFILAMYWKRATPWSGLYGLIAGTLGAAVIHVLYTGENISWLNLHFAPQLGFGSAQSANFFGAITAFGADAAVMVIVSMFTAPKPEKELAGLVWGTTRRGATGGGDEGRRAVVALAQAARVRRTWPSPSPSTSSSSRSQPWQRQLLASHDKAIQTTEEAEQRARGARLFDIRRLIGALFVVYGIVLIIVGLMDSKAEIRKAAGVHINLWTGLGMLDLRHPDAGLGLRPPGDRRRPADRRRQRHPLPAPLTDPAPPAVHISTAFCHLARLLACSGVSQGEGPVRSPPTTAHGPSWWGGPTDQLMTRDGKTRSGSYGWGTWVDLPRSHSGAHQLRAPAASSPTAAARSGRWSRRSGSPPPGRRRAASCRCVLSVAKTLNTAIMTAAALVTTPAEVVMPCRTASVVDSPRIAASRIRLTTNTW